MNMSPAPTRSQKQTIDCLPASRMNLNATLDETLDDIDLDDELHQEIEAWPETDILDSESDTDETGNDEAEAFNDHYNYSEAISE